jgi:hypothetical protein
LTKKIWSKKTLIVTTGLNIKYISSHVGINFSGDRHWIYWYISKHQTIMATVILHKECIIALWKFQHTDFIQSFKNMMQTYKRQMYLVTALKFCSKLNQLFLKSNPES